MTTHSILGRRRAAAVAAGCASMHPVYFVRAKGAELWDAEGRHYIDFGSGIGVNNVGNLHPQVVEAILHQLALSAHTAFGVAGYESYIALCEALNALAPIGDARSALFTTGAEAMENAVKVARLATGRQGVVAFAGGFHGRSLLTSSMTGKVSPYRLGVTPAVPGIHHIPFPMASCGVQEDESRRALERLFKATIAPEQVAAIVIEPVQGEGGFHPAPPTFMQYLRRVCNQHGICLVVDEIQSGFGRTGKFFAVEHSGVEPDLMAIGKSIGGGLPLSGLIGKAAIMNAVPPGGLGGTFAGNPVACAAALAVLRVMREERLTERATVLGARIEGHVRRMKAAGGSMPIGDVRATGMMVAFDLVDASQAPDPEAAQRLVVAACEAGVILLPCGYHGNTIRLSLPLTIGEDLLDEGMVRVARSMGIDPARLRDADRAGNA